MSGIYFKPLLNTAVTSDVIDNDFTTSVSTSTITCHIDSTGDGTGAATPFTHIFMKSSAGVTGYAAAVTGGNALGVNVTTPDTVTDSSGNTVDTIIDGFKNDLFHWEGGNTKTTAKTITFTFTGSGIQIYELWILDALLILGDKAFIAFAQEDELPYQYQKDIWGHETEVPLMQGDRARRIVTITVKPEYGDRTDKYARQIRSILRNYGSYVFATEPTRYPDEVFWARTLNDPRLNYRNTMKALGRNIAHVIKEL